MEHPVHLITEVILVVFVIYLWSTKSFKQPVQEEKLTTAEEDQLIQEWSPEPLVPPISEDDRTYKYFLEGPVGAHTKVNSKDCLNFVSNGVLGLQNHPLVKEAAIATARKFGVGSCGPRGFYGSLQPHLDFENDIAKFMGAEAGVLYPSELQTIATVIPAFSKATDYVVVDKGCSFGIQSGVGLSRSKVIWFDHNDMQSLERGLETLKEVFLQKVHRVFVVIEGIYANYGDIVPLDEVMKLKERFPFRIIIDESYSFGVLGKTGKGVTEHFDIPAADIEILVASNGNALGAVGGFAVGQEEICGHQRINCTGYVFSCASPPFTSAAASEGLKLLTNGDIKSSELRAKAKRVHEKVNAMLSTSLWSGDNKGKDKDNSKSVSLGNIFENISAIESPYIHLRVTKVEDREEIEDKLHEVIDHCFESGVLITNASYSNREKYRPNPGLKLSVPLAMTNEEIDRAMDVLKNSLEKVFSS